MAKPERQTVILNILKDNAHPLTAREVAIALRHTRASVTSSEASQILSNLYNLHQVTRQIRHVKYPTSRGRIYEYSMEEW